MLVTTLLLVFIEAVVSSSYSCASDTACIFVDNQCPFTLYLQRTTIDGNENFPTTLTTLPQKEQTKVSIEGWRGLPGQRLYAWWVNPIGQNWTDSDTIRYRDKVEINWCFSSPNPDTMCYNPTAVDYFALPVEIGPYNSSDCPTVPMTGAYNVKQRNIKSNCPTVYDETPPAGRCKSPSHACLNPNDTSELCSHLDPVLQTCVADGVCIDGVTSEHVYACSESLAGNPPLCAALNRGVYQFFNTIHDTNTSLFYETPPYNEYCKWIHSGGGNPGGKEYAFPYDDYGAQSSGYEVCTTNFMSVTFCPADRGDVTTTEIPTTVAPTPRPTVEPTHRFTTTVGPTAEPTMHNSKVGIADKYDFHDMVIAVCVGFGAGVGLMGFVMVIYKCIKQKRRSLNEQLLDSISER